MLIQSLLSYNLSLVPMRTCVDVVYDVVVDVGSYGLPIRDFLLTYIELMCQGNCLSFVPPFVQC